MDKKLRFVIVGHIDHGKSTLIGRLLYDTNSLPEEAMEEIKKAGEMLGRKVEFAHIMDHLSEEREKGITIDTAQTFFKNKGKEYVIIDAPGHKEFLKNMITGASQAEAAILMLDVNEGIMEQTKRHAYILNLLGIKQVVVAMNKMDLVNYSEEKFKKVRDELTKFLESINVKPTYFIPISAFNGENIVKKSENMKFYGGPTILEALDSFHKKKDREDSKLIFPVQDVYEIDGKRIIVGKVECGKISKGDSLVALPSKHDITVNTIEKFLENSDSASAGESIGITASGDDGIKRGSVISGKVNPPRIKREFSANVFWMSPKKVMKGEKLIMQIATREVNCEIEKISRRINSSTLEIIGSDADRLEETEVGEVVIKTESPVAIESFNDVEELGRFVLIKNQDISGGGIITSK